MDVDAIHLLQALPEPAMIVDAEGAIFEANEAARAAGAPRTLTGERLWSFVVNPPEHVREYLRICSRSRHPVPTGLGWIAADGKIINMRADGNVLKPRTPHAPAILFIRLKPRADSSDPFLLLNQKIEALSKEVFDRKKAERQRDDLLESERAARIDAERNSRLKDEFLATLSHELRTPLTAILGWTHLLQRAPDAASFAQGLSVIQRNAQLQRQLIEDLLDMSRIISGKLRMDVQRVDAAMIIEAAIQAVRPAADAKGIRIDTAVDPLAGPLNGDPSRLQQIVWNLLSNAVKFTPKGGRVQVALRRSDPHVEIAVSDTGEGIQPEFLPHVFERFRQADSSTTRRVGGLGLGLSIVKHLVELHGGNVRAQSPGPGQGSVFTVSIPVLDTSATEERPRATLPPLLPGAREVSQSDIDLRGVKVLVVDDEPDARDLVQRLLTGSGAVVRTAASSMEAWSAVETDVPAVIVSDIGMPEVDGYELVRRIRSLPAGRGGDTPALALSAFARSDDRTRAMRAGFNFHLSKPVDPPELIAAVASLAGQIGRGDAQKPRG